MRAIPRFTEGLDNLFFEEYKFHEKTLGLYRIFFALFLIFIMGIPDFRGLNSFPSYIYDPPFFSFASFFSGFPGYFFLVLITVFIFVLHFFVLFGYKTKASSILLTILLIVGYNFYFSFGKINHGRMITIWVPLFMGLANWGSAYSIDSLNRRTDLPNKTKGWPIFILLTLLAFGMFSAGLPKLLSGWLNTSSHAVQGHLIQNYYVHHRQALLAPLFASIGSDVFWESFDYFGVLFEVGFIFALLRKKFLHFYIIFAIIFHIINLLILNISFISNLPVYLILFTWNLLPYEKIKSFLNQVLTLKVFIGSIFTALVLYFIFGVDITLYSIFSWTGLDRQVFDLVIMLSILCIYVAGVVFYYRQIHVIREEIA